jgi:hypothetical protein
LVAAVVVGALLARLLVVALYRKGGTDLQIFYFFADFVHGGHNPYHPPANAPIAIIHSDNPPFLIRGMALLLAIYHSRDTLRVASAILEAVTVFTILAFAPRSRVWRLAVGSFVAFNPFTLIAWTAFFEDKGEIFLLLVILLIAIERGQLALAWAASAVVGALNWLIVFVPALLIETYHRLGRRAATLCLAAFGFVYVVSYIPYFPSDLEAYVRRSDQLGAPFHASFDVFLAEAGLYTPALVAVLVPLSLVAIYAAQLRRLISVEETVVLSVLAVFVFLPNHTTHRIALTTLPFLFIIRLTTARLAMIWLASALGAIADIVARNGVPFGSHLGPLASAAAHIFGPRLGAPGYVAFGNTLTFLMLGLFVTDKLHERRARVLRCDANVQLSSVQPST